MLLKHNIKSMDQTVIFHLITSISIVLTNDRFGL